MGRTGRALFSEFCFAICSLHDCGHGPVIHGCGPCLRHALPSLRVHRELEKSRSCPLANLRDLQLCWPPHSRRAWSLRYLCRSMLMMYWYPRGYDPLTNSVRNGNIAMGVTTGVYLIKEFSPELKRIFHRRF